MFMPMPEFNEFDLHSVESVFQQGLDLLESDHFEEAIHAFDFVVEQQPFNADALFHRGIALVNLSRVDEAISSFEHALELAPTEALFHSHYGHALLMAGKSEDALQHFDYALQIQPDSYQNKIYKACTLAERRKYGEARALLEEVLEEHPDEVEAHRHYGNVLASMGEDDAAMEEYEWLLQKNPNHLEAISRKASIYLRHGNQQEAVRCLREYLALNPADARAWFALLEALSDMNEFTPVVVLATEAIVNHPELPQLFLYRGRALLELSRHDEALADLRRARAANDRLPEVHLLLSRLFAEQGRSRHALISVNRALQINSDDRQARLLKASLHHKLGEYKEEVQVLEKLLAETPGEYPLVKMTAEVHASIGNLDRACGIVEAFLILAPRHRKALSFAARINEQAGNLPMARRRYRQLMCAPSVSSQNYVAYAGFLVRMGENENACTILNRAVTEHPADVPLCGFFAVVLQMLGKHESCIDIIEKTIARVGESSELVWLKAKSLHGMNRYEEALVAFRQANTLSGKNSTVRLRAITGEACSLSSMNRNGEAIRLLESCKPEQQEEQQELALLLSDVYESGGMHLKAVGTLRSVAEKHPGNATIRYRVARAASMAGLKKEALHELSSTILMDPKYSQIAGDDIGFSMFWYSIALNKMLFWKPLRRRMKPTIATGFVVFALLSSLVFWARHA